MDKANSKPLISTSLSAESLSMLQQTPITPGNANQSPILPSEPQLEDMENLYPDIYKDLYPVVLAAVNSLIAAGYTITPDAIDDIVDNIIRNSGLWYEDEDDGEDMEPETMPVQLGFGRMPYRRRRRRYHNRGTLRDLVRILLLRELFTRGNNQPYLWR